MLAFHKGTIFSCLSQRQTDRYTDAKLHSFNGSHITLQTYQAGTLYHCPIQGYLYLGQ